MRNDRVLTELPRDVDFPKLIVALRGVKISTALLGRWINVNPQTLQNYIKKPRKSSSKGLAVKPPHEVGNNIVEVAVNSFLSDEILSSCGIKTQLTSTQVQPLDE